MSDDIKEKISIGGPDIFGTLLSGKELVKISKIKSKKFIEKKIRKEHKNEYIKKGWEVNRELKREFVFRKDKEELDFLIDETWVLFERMGFSQIASDSNFTILDGDERKKIHIFAKDKHNVFIILCENQKEKIKEKISEISKIKKGLSKSIKKQYEPEKLKISFLIISKNNEDFEKNVSLASEKNIHFIDGNTFESFQHLSNQLGPSTKYQLFAYLFRNKECKELGKVTIPAIYGGVGDKYYTFLIQPEKLFPYIYVNRREKGYNAKDIEITYQRMVSKNRINDIKRFVEKGNSFPNNLIISFNEKQKPKFEKKDKKGDIQYGLLTFPPFYGCAWIIDGQHRFYGYSKSNKASSHTMPVIAYESQKIKDQANLFVNINKKQQSVNNNLLWDLYPDIYEGSDDGEHQLLRAISLIAKKLNFDKDSPFHNHIQIPSIVTNDRKKTNLTLTNICEAIKENGLVHKDEGLLFNNNYDDSINFAEKRIKDYFEIISSLLPGDWEKGKNGLLRTNVGLRIFFKILRQYLRFLKYKSKEDIYLKSDLKDFKKDLNQTLESVQKALRKKTNEEKAQIRKASTKGQVDTNTQKLIWILFKDENFGAELWSNGGWTPGTPENESDEKIKRIIDDTEIKLRSLIIKKLKELYKDKWYRQGIPGDVKKYINDRIQEEINDYPWKKDELENLTTDKKLIYSSTGHLKIIIENSDNWGEFESVFGKDKISMGVLFKFYGRIRNKYKHPEREKDLDETEKGLGYYCMGWIRKCLGLNPRNM
ncbi:DGQHR domain-containing protein [Candidatus Woesearchaeota archaeon]|nr:DGQHR domain-containing protein [Candidatus Woesearchaeota archaeon]